MAKTICEMVIVGPLAGRTMEIMGVPFVGGRAELPPKGVEPLINALNLFHNVWEEGTEEHEKAVLEFEDSRALAAQTAKSAPVPERKPEPELSPMEKLSAALGSDVKDMNNAALKALAKERFDTEITGNRAALLGQLMELVMKTEEKAED